jgi:hypothetical protein
MFPGLRLVVARIRVLLHKGSLSVSGTDSSSPAVWSAVSSLGSSSSSDWRVWILAPRSWMRKAISRLRETGTDDSAASKPPKKKKTPDSDTKTAPAQTTIDNDKKKPTPDNVSKPAAPLPPKPPCNCMCPLEQSASGTSKIEWTTDVVDDSAASKPPPKKKTPHSDPTTVPAQTTIDNNKKTPTSDNVSTTAAVPIPLCTGHLFC